MSLLSRMVIINFDFTPKQFGEFYKSSFCAGGECATVAKQIDGSVRVRDDKNEPGPVLVFTRAEWVAFLKGVKNNEFNV